MLPVIEDIATEIGILYEGELVAEGAPNDLIARMEVGKERTLEDIFLEATTDEVENSDP